LWYAWFIDNLFIGNATQIVRFAGSDLVTRSSATSRSLSELASLPNAPSPSRAALNGFKYTEPGFSVQHTAPNDRTRSLQGYKVWRLQAGAENNPALWVPLTPENITVLTHSDPAWNGLPNGSYRWAVRAIYTAEVSSVPSFSNILEKETLSGNIVGFVRKTNNQPIAGATVSANGVNATTNTAGAYSLALQVGTYSVTASATNYLPLTQDGIEVTANQNTTLNFVLTGVAGEDDLAPVVATALGGNYPNPFNPETVISYAIKNKCAVNLDIYNLKGQRVRSLVSAVADPGNYRIVFNGKDDNGQALSSGIYLYRLKAGEYISSRKMMLME
jgi:hypothetical protein